MAALRQRRGQPAAGGATSAESHPTGAPGSDESSGEDEYLPIGPLSLYFPDALVREVMARDPGGEISFIEAEQALLHSDADADGAVRHVHEQRRDRARRRAEGGDALGGFSHHRELAEQLGAARGAGGGGGSTSQNIMRWLVSVASTAILVLVVLALLIVAMVDGVIEVPDSVKSAARVLADGRRPGRP